MATLLLAAFCLAVAPASAASLVLEAEVRMDLQSIVGEVVATDMDGIRLVDALSRLPVPQDDVLLRRTFPFAAEQGWVRPQLLARLNGF